MVHCRVVPKPTLGVWEARYTSGPRQVTHGSHKTNKRLQRCANANPRARRQHRGSEANLYSSTFRGSLLERNSTVQLYAKSRVAWSLSEPYDPTWRVENRPALEAGSLKVPLYTDKLGGVVSSTAIDAAVASPLIGLTARRFVLEVLARAAGSRQGSPP